MPPIKSRLFVAYSGGVDSHVLLHLCAHRAELQDKVTAVYVHHGLQAVADDWAEHCRQQAEALGVTFVRLDVDARAQAGESPEAAAREARYRALKSLIKPGDVVALAQHREDQMETLLLQLFRGAGVAGLAAMPASASFGEGRMIRPLLDTGKSAILDYAARHHLQWVDDPTNLGSDFDRNFLRNQVVPLLKQRWPSLDKTVARSSRHCADAQSLLDDWSQGVIGELIEPKDRSLSLDKLSIHTPEQRDYLLRSWLKGMGLKAPSQAVLDVIVHQMIAARDDADPRMTLQGRCLRRYRQRLYCLHDQTSLPLLEPKIWPVDMETLTLDQGRRLQRRVANQGIAQRFWHRSIVSVRPRQGGERLKLPGRAGRHALKKLYQEAAIPPWERDVRPLIYVDDRLAAVAGLWIDEWAFGVGDEPCYQIDWGYADPF